MIKITFDVFVVLKVSNPLYFFEFDTIKFLFSGYENSEFIFCEFLLL